VEKRNPEEDLTGRPQRNTPEEDSRG